VLGEFALGPAQARWLRERETPQVKTWPTTDDTEMGMAVVETLEERGCIDQDLLAQRFASRFARDPHRGYGGTARRILAAIGAGGDFRSLAPAVFNGQGSMGNGAAMRATPIGAWFADEPERAAREARLSAGPTHASLEGEEGAIAAALGAAWAARKGEGLDDGPLCAFVPRFLRPGKVRDGVERAGRLDPNATVLAAVQALGSGQQVLAQDTVPFCLWCTGREPDSFAAALWVCAEGHGDRDTTCAITGGMVALSAGRASIPPEWLQRRELPPPTVL
jgi:ADP-ribosylglycohydrolase